MRCGVHNTTFLHMLNLRGFSERKEAICKNDLKLPNDVFVVFFSKNLFFCRIFYF